ncbi:hypothetical protein EDD22DRAFT_1014784 [Suillus occidentalis]|nr:hypothetical protein EDD22DRAFT_1014784 [Suillus occidentalis]
MHAVANIHQAVVVHQQRLALVPPMATILSPLAPTHPSPFWSIQSVLRGNAPGSSLSATQTSPTLVTFHSSYQPLLHPRAGFAFISPAHVLPPIPPMTHVLPHLYMPLLMLRDRMANPQLIHVYSNLLPHFPPFVTIPSPVSDAPSGLRNSLDINIRKDFGAADNDGPYAPFSAPLGVLDHLDGDEMTQDDVGALESSPQVTTPTLCITVSPSCPP